MPPLNKISFNKFGGCFESLVTLKIKPHHITLDSNPEPVINARRIVRKGKEVDTMIELGMNSCY